MKILVGIPTYDRRIDIDLFHILMNLERKGTYNFDYMFPVSSHISRNRNMICVEALKEKHDAILFLDSDIGIYDDTFFDLMIETAYKLDAKIVGGAYRMKKPDLDDIIYIAGKENKEGKIENIKKDILSIPYEVDGLGTGIMLVFREVLEKLEDPWFTIVDKKNFDVMPEDFEFCRKAKLAGFKVALEPRFETRHYGSFGWKHSF